MFVTNTLKVKQISIVIFIYAFIVFYSSAFHQLRQLIYIIIPLSFLFAIKNKNITIKYRGSGNEKAFINYFIFISIVTIMSFFFNFNSIIPFRFLKEFIFINGALISALLVFSFANRDSLDLALKYLVILSAVFSIIFDPTSLLSLLKFDFISFFVDSSSVTESGIGFIAGLLALYFFPKRKIPMITCVILILLGSKRIVILGFLLCITLYFILIRIKSFQSKSSYFSLIMAILNVFLVIILTKFACGSYDKYVIEYTGLTPNFITQGRTNLYAGILQRTDGLSIIPEGLGYTSSVLIKTNSTGLTLLHSDILKYALELGILLFGILMFLLYQLSKGKPKTFIIIVFCNILMISDNIFIYFEVMFVFYLIIFSLSKLPENRKLSEDIDKSGTNSIAHI